MLKNIFRQSKKTKAVDPLAVIERLNDFSPPSVLASLRMTTGGSEANEPLGRAVILRMEGQFFTEGDCFFLSTPEGMKAGQGSLVGGRGNTLSLQFLHRRVPHSVECRIVGRRRLQPEVARSLDFKVLSAFKLRPLSNIKKADKRNYLRYVLDNYGDQRVPRVPYVDFDVFANQTNQAFPEAGAPRSELDDLRPILRSPPDPSRSFDAADAVEEFRVIMRQKPPGARQVHLTKVVKSQQLRSGRQTPEESYLLGFVDSLGLDKELRIPVIYTRKSAKSDAKKDNPCNLKPGDRVLLEFAEDGYHEMLCEVHEARMQNECLRPLAYMQSEGGVQIHPVDFGVGGTMVESSPELLRTILGDRCPPEVDEHPTYEGAFWEQFFEELRRPMIQLSFYPKLHFTENLEQFRPELPFRITVISQIMRSQLVSKTERSVLLHGMRFAYDPMGVPLTWEEMVRWKLMHGFRDNDYFREVHSKLSLTYGFLQHRKQTIDPTTA